MTRKPVVFIQIIACFVAMVASAGCEENLAPRDRFDRPFSMYGVISPDLHVQSIRVYPLEEFISLTPPEPGDISFTSIDLDTGERRVWQDSLEAESGGLYEHIFWSAFRAEYGHRYRVEVERARDGARSYAELRVPPHADLQMSDADSTVVQVRIEGEDLRVLKPEVGYMVNGSRNGGIPPGPFRFYTISYEGVERQVETGWELTIQTTRDRRNVQSLYTAEFQSGGINCPILDLREIVLKVIVGDGVWDPPGGVFDPDILSFPNTLSNVENGLGFIGSGYRLSRSLFPRRATVEYACFNYVWE